MARAVRGAGIERSGGHLDPRRAVQAQGIECWSVQLIEAAAALIYRRGGQSGVIGIERAGAASRQ